MVEVGRGVWRLSGPIHGLKHGYLDQVAQDHVQTTSEDFQGDPL